MEVTNRTSGGQMADARSIRTMPSRSSRGCLAARLQRRAVTGDARDRFTGLCEKLGAIRPTSTPAAQITRAPTGSADTTRRTTRSPDRPIPTSLAREPDLRRLRCARNPSREDVEKLNGSAPPRTRPGGKGVSPISTSSPPRFEAATRPPMESPLVPPAAASGGWFARTTSRKASLGPGRSGPPKPGGRGQTDPHQTVIGHLHSALR